MRRHRRKIAVGVGIVLIVVVGISVLIELMLPTGIIPRARYQCTIRNITAQPVAVSYRQSQENTWHTTVVDTRWIEPGDVEVFSYSLKDRFIAGNMMDENDLSIDIEKWIPIKWFPSSYISPDADDVFEILQDENGILLFKEIHDASR